MTHNELKKGTKVLLRGGCMGTLQDNRKGLCRCVKVEPFNGYCEDIGDVYVDEITHVLDSFDRFPLCGTRVELSSAHAKKMAVIRAIIG